jgi:hypothetical protein
VARQYDKKNICQGCAVVEKFARKLYGKVERITLLTMQPRMETQMKLEGMVCLIGFVKSHTMIVVIIVDVRMYGETDFLGTR